MNQSILPYRPCVGLVLFNAQGKVWIGQRISTHNRNGWQCPQGGIDKGETPRQAVEREMFEETGLTSTHYDILEETQNWLTYDLPSQYKQTPELKNFRGQKQKWFALRFCGHDSDFNLKAHAPQEFSQWKWVQLSELPQLIIPFKRPVYEHIAHIFTRYTQPEK